MSLHWAWPLLDESPEFERGAAALQRTPAAVWVEGLAGTAKWFVAAALAEKGHRGRGLPVVQAPLLIITASEEAAETAVEDLPAIGFRPGEIGLFPSVEGDGDDLVLEAKVLASSEAPERRAVARSRLAVLEALSRGELRVVVAPVHAVMRETLASIEANQLTIRMGAPLDLEETARRLAEMGYERVPMVEGPGQFAIRGGLIDLYPSTRPRPTRIELFGDEVESLREFDLESQRSLREVPELTVIAASETSSVTRDASSVIRHSSSDKGADASRMTNDASRITPGKVITLLDHFPPDALVCLDEPNHLRARWEEFQETLARRRAEVAEADRVVAEHLMPNAGQSRYLSLDDLARRLEARRVAYFTLLAHQVSWLRPVAQTAVQLSINSGTLDTAHGDIPELANRIRTWIGVGHEVAALSDQPHRVAELLAEHDLPVTVHEAGVQAFRRSGVQGDASEHPNVESPETETPERPNAERLNAERRDRRLVHVAEGRLSAGFRLPGIKLTVLTDAEIFGERRARPRPRPTKQTFREGRPIMSLLELKEGDLVVHVSHGIGRYRGLVRMESGGVEREFLRIDYQAPDKLYVPTDQLDRVQKYIGSEESAPTLHRLGGGEWFRTKSRVKARVREMAKELVALYAARKANPGYAYGPDTVWQEEMEAAFEYQETDDQLQAIHDVKADLELDRPMDRLICGDVGFGKTEVALRAAFKAVNEGKQVAVLVPTTVLAQQHFNTFSERLAAFPVKVEMLSRFRSRAEQKKILEGLQQGVIDIVIGTHRLLSKDVQFRELGLLVVDEEQRFGVAHKEKIKQLRTAVDVLTLTATPIPRTLHMSLAGIRDMSVIEDPPEGRLAVRTYCMEAEDRVIRDAILRELDRGGQVYYVHNRIDTIYQQASRLQQLVPQARIRVGHGQMKEDDLEEVMLDFYDHEFDILCCTTIIESGLDVPNVNTIVINDADHLGLAQLHQLRGRVGRSSRQAYCYLLYKPFKELTEVAEKRLQAVREFTELGAGFRIAMRDMEIRGAGNLLGGEQHGFIASVGFDLYCRMIEEAVKELQGQVVEEVLLPGVSLPISAFIPHDYIPTEALRIAMYKKIAACREMQHVAMVQEELEDRFGDPPKPVWHLLALMRLRIQCLAAGVARIEYDKSGVTLWLARRVEKEEVKELFRKFRRAQFLPDRILLYAEPEQALAQVEQLVDALRARGGAKAVEAVQRQLQAAEAAGLAGAGAR